MPDVPEIHLGKLTRREFRQRMESGELQACILPVAAVEQHLEHLAMEHDWRSVLTVAERVATRLAPRVLVAEGLMAGVSEHHMRHGGTLTLKPGTFLAVLYDLIDSLVRAGFQHVLVLNGHGGNIAPCRGIWGQFLQLSGANVQFLPYWEVLTPEQARQHLQTGVFPGHAQEFETAVALAAFPENVRQAALTDQADTSPALARRESGAALLDLIVAGVTQHLDDMLAGRNVAEIPAFFP
jgi:creatinine amidohydrolase